MRPHRLQELARAVQTGPPFDENLMTLLANDAREGARRLYERCQRQQARTDAEAARAHALLAFERDAHAAGYTRVAGVDEAGRGPLAGPIVAAAVILHGDAPAGLNDSKQVTEARREELYEVITTGPHTVGVAVISPADIDAWGIQPANMNAMRRAVDALRTPPDYLLVDGFALPGAPCPHARIIKGDARSLSIAAASIVAKVTRDRLMNELEETYPGYGFARHKGYGTQAHLDALAALGPCPAHRRSFAPLAPAPPASSPSPA